MVVEWTVVQSNRISQKYIYQLEYTSPMGSLTEPGEPPVARKRIPWLSSWSGPTDDQWTQFRVIMQHFQGLSRKTRVRLGAINDFNRTSSRFRHSLQSGRETRISSLVDQSSESQIWSSVRRPGDCFSKDTPGVRGSQCCACNHDSMRQHGQARKKSTREYHVLHQR